MATQVKSPQISDFVENSSMARQAVMNGNFDIWQRGTSFSIVPGASVYSADRWKDDLILDGGTQPTLTRSRQILTPGDIANSYFYNRLVTSGAGSGYGANAYSNFFETIENGTRNLCGLNKKVTLSFYARSSITNKKIGIWLYQAYGSGGSPSSPDTINGRNWTLTSTWTKYTHTFTTATLVGKTFGTVGDDAIAPVFTSMWGTGIASVWVGSTGVAETFVGAGNIDIAQVQLCAGDEALPFEPKSYGQELADCQRYCFPFPHAKRVRMTNFTANIMEFGIQYPCNMRIAPTLGTAGVEATDWQVFTTGISAQTGFALTLGGSGTGGGYLTLTKTSHGLTDGFLAFYTRTPYLQAEL